jgi:quinoprotein glucose dehydrogenase
MNKQIRKILRFAGLISAAVLIGLMTPIGLQSQSGYANRYKAEWLNYGSDKANTKYSPLTQINKDNFKHLKVAWTLSSPDEPVIEANPDLKLRKSYWYWEGTPLMVDGVLYVSTSLSQVMAIDAVTGETRWVYDPETWKGTPPPNHGFVHRGVAYWADGKDQRILFGTGDGYLICLNAQTGKPISAFGEDGRIDLTQGLGRPVTRHYYGVTSPPIICRDVVAVGASIQDFPLEKEMPPGDVRGFDVRTGRQLWQFHAIPKEGEFGNETWEQDSWKYTGGANVWTMMSADETLGYIYLPFSTPTNDYYGGQRPGDGLFGESLVCLDARNGKRVWHFQMVHHGLWDYDLPAAPNLIDIRVNGRPIKAIAQVSKQGFCYVLDRITGKPVWPIEERPVPQSTVPGEKVSPTQPFPTKPAPFDRQGVTVDDIIDFTPELRREALTILERYNYGPLFTPPSLEKPTIAMPGIAGGASWAGAACDPETGLLYVPSITIPFTTTMFVPSEFPHASYAGLSGVLEDVQGLPLWKPPYGRITAIDLNTGDHRWMVPMGDLDRRNTPIEHLDLPPLGQPTRGHILLTKTLLIVGQEFITRRTGASMQGGAMASDIYAPKLRAYDKATGKVVGEVTVPRHLTGAPMTYRLGGKQYIVFPTGGGPTGSENEQPAELIALYLP